MTLAKLERVAPIREGEILAGKYKVERVLAHGGMGVIVAAIHQQLDQRVALKFLLPEQTKNEALIGRFLREARAAVRLRSEHVARVLDVGTAETGSPYIVMEYLEGRDLAVVLDEERQLSVRAAVTYVLQASEAVAEAHALGIVHRDLKPANLFLTTRPDGSPCVKVLDFGISKLRGSELDMTKTSALLGTPFYMSPEQLRSSKDVDVRADIWALGMILYQLLTGVVAFDRETLPELCMAILEEPLPPLSTSRPELAPELSAVIEKALTKSRDDRYQTLAELATALAPFSPTGHASEQRIHRILGIGTPHSDAPPPDPGARASSPSLTVVMPPSSARDATSGHFGSSSGQLPSFGELPSSDQLPSPHAISGGDTAPVRGLSTRALIGFSVVMTLAAGIGVTAFVLARRAPRPTPAAFVEASAPLASAAPATELAPEVPAPAKSPEKEPEPAAVAPEAALPRAGLTRGRARSRARRPRRRARRRPRDQATTT
ncbi:MAG: protein kinase [Labilithrix sp.]|nr:protein kinase [Labilithrix sp.]